jgi:hypothetical protein
VYGSRLRLTVALTDAFMLIATVVTWRLRHTVVRLVERVGARLLRRNILGAALRLFEVKGKILRHHLHHGGLVGRLHLLIVAVGGRSTVPNTLYVRFAFLTLAGTTVGPSSWAVCAPLPTAPLGVGAASYRLAR